MRISDWSSDVCSSDLFFAGLAFFAVSPASMAADSADSNPIVVATDATFPPFELEKDGKLEGFDIDMIKAIAKAENLNIKLKTMPFDGIIPSLKEIGRASCRERVCQYV